MTTFVNGLVSEKDEETVVKEEEKDDNKYYEMVTESAKCENGFNKLNNVLENIKLMQINEVIASAPLMANEATTVTEASAPFRTIIEQNILPQDKIKTLAPIEKHQDKHLIYPKLKHFQREKCVLDANTAIEEDLNDLLEIDNQLYSNNELVKELECYFYSNILFEVEKIEHDFYLNRNSHDLPIYYCKNEFYELLKDYYESRLLVNNCVKHIEYLRYECSDYASHRIWLFEKFLVESSSYCGDNIRIKHSIESEKAFLNKEDLNKLEKLLTELRLNIKYSLISSKFCSKLTYSKIESFLNDFFSDNDCDCINGTINTTKLMKIFANSHRLNELNLLIDIIFYFIRKKQENDEDYYSNLNKILSDLLVIRLNLTNLNKIQTQNDLDFLLNLFQHLLHLPNTYNRLDEFIDKHIQLPIIIDCNFNILNFYIKILLLFTTKLKTREYFLNEFHNLEQAATASSTTLQQQVSANNWLFIDLDGNLENMEQSILEINEDELIKLYSKVSFSQIFHSLWQYVNNNGQNESIMKIYSFLNYLTRLLINSIIQYNRLKYKNFCKLISKTLSNCLKYCSLICNKFKSQIPRVCKHYDDFIRRICIKLIYYKNINSIRW